MRCGKRSLLNTGLLLEHKKKAEFKNSAFFNVTYVGFLKAAWRCIIAKTPAFAAMWTRHIITPLPANIAPPPARVARLFPNAKWSDVAMANTCPRSSSHTTVAAMNLLDQGLGIRISKIECNRRCSDARLCTLCIAKANRHQNQRNRTRCFK